MCLLSLTCLSCCCCIHSFDQLGLHVAIPFQAEPKDDSAKLGSVNRTPFSFPIFSSTSLPTCNWSQCASTDQAVTLGCRLTECLSWTCFPPWIQLLQLAPEPSFCFPSPALKTEELPLLPWNSCTVSPTSQQNGNLELWCRTTDPQAPFYSSEVLSNWTYPAQLNKKSFHCSSIWKEQSKIFFERWL